MSDESAFLRAMLAAPENAVPRLTYADWLEGRDGPRAQLLRLDPGLERISYIDWLENQGNLDYYIQHFPEVKLQAEARKRAMQLQEQLKALGAKIDPGWMAFVNTVGCPFHPFFFFDNSGSSRAFGPDELPFHEPIGTRGAVLTFASAFRDESCWDPGLVRDLQFLCQLPLDDCYYGAATSPVHPFVCELKSGRRPLTGVDVIGALKVRDFRSDHIETLDATNISFPGYHPQTDNDEIHNDFDEQNIFRRLGDADEEDDGDDDNGQHMDAYAHLKAYVEGEPVWYVLLHGTPDAVIEGARFSRYVVLFAVGRSPHGNRLMGVVTHQVCHNLCD